MTASGGRAESGEPTARGDLGTVAGLALGPVVGLGFARFAYALLLPPMRTDLGWSFTTAGVMNTVNAVGYLVGAVVATALARAIGSRRAFTAGIVVTAVALLLSATSGNLALLLVLRLVAGVAGAVSFVVGGGLAASASRRHGPGRAALLLGVYFCGGGAGIVLSGIIVNPVLAHTTIGAGWRIGWLILGGLSAIGAIVAVWTTRRLAEPELARSRGDRWPASRLIPLMGAYLFFGIGYISYMTFIVAYLKHGGAGGPEVTWFWVVLGATSIAATYFWGPILGRLRGGRGPALVLLVVAIGAAVPLIWTSVWAAFASALLFGGSFLSLVTAITTVARQSLHPRHWTAAIGTMTVTFAIGQCIGPVLAGAVSDGPHGVLAGLALSVAIILAGAVIALFQRDRTPEPVG